jgi:RNA polymerase-binding transcription factor DksA
MDDSTYRRVQLSQKRQNKIDYGICSICGESNPLVMKHGELHHIDGNKISNETTLVCPNCHYSITEEQNKLPPSIRTCKTATDKLIFVSISHAALLRRIAEIRERYAIDLEVQKNEDNK